MGGATLPFKLEDGSVDMVKGPWCSNTRALFSDTGIDLRDQHFIKYVICKDLVETSGIVYCKNVLELVNEPSPMEFSHADKVAQKYANQLGEQLRYVRVSSGGSCIGYANPEES